MTRGTGIRQYRACVRCRGRKTRCDLQSYGEIGKPPCAKCVREGADCVLAGSRRGGNFAHLRGDGSKMRRRQETEPTPMNPSPVTPFHSELPSLGPEPRDEPVHGNLQNPSDALLILAHAAEDNEAGETQSPETISEMRSSRVHQPTPVSLYEARSHSSTGYQPVQDGSLSPELLDHLLRQSVPGEYLGALFPLAYECSYSDHYHPFFPIVPSDILSSKRLSDTVRNETFLLTAVLVVATRERPDLVNVHKSVWKYMRNLILDVVLGMPNIRSVGCVEGLLLLGEWTPFKQAQTDDGGEGAAWSIIGLAVRLAYLLRLEDTSFKSDKDTDESMQRRRLAWTFTYLSDRQISIRMGQAFWCRGPSLSARFTAADFPSLQPKRSYDEDFASVLQAQVELTTLFGNAHDILFASKQRTTELMVRGDYKKYIDDTANALDAWQRAWGNLAVSQHLKCCLMLMQQYLRLYVHAFAFQAVLYRSSSGQTGEGNAGARTTFCFPESAMASPDARAIYEAVDAAETLLKIVVEDVDPERYLRFMPERYYLYEIHSAVFLYKAHVAGAISSGRYAQTASLMRRFISLLTAAATDADHIASKYAKLLSGLFFRRPTGQPSGRQVGSTEVELQSQADDSLDTLSAFTPSAGMVQMPLFDGLGLQQFDCTDTVDGLFSLPALGSWDPSFL